MSWRHELEAIQSLGQQDQGVSSLAELHVARKRHLSQFFTPLSVVQIMWAIATQSFPHRKLGRINVLDTSIGTGRLMHFATPDEFHIGGVDIHADVVTQVMKQAEAHKLSAEVLCAGMQDIRPTGWDISLLNPPFSINLESATLHAYPCVKHGRLGPATAAQSDEYAVAQALDASEVVIAVVPKSLALDLELRGDSIVGASNTKRLRAVLYLGGKAFLEEGANVETCIVVYGHDKGRFVGSFKVEELKDLPNLNLQIFEIGRKPRLRPVRYDTSEPSITLAVTGNNSVRVVHSGRDIGLKFACGGTQARVLNKLYRTQVYSSEVHRLPKGVKYAGQGLLDVQVILSSDDPMETFASLIEIINQAGGQAQVDPGLQNYLTRLVREKPRLVTPLGHWVFRSEHEEKIQAIAKCRVPVEPKLMLAPSLKTGDSIELKRIDDGWAFSMKAWTRKLCHEEATRLFAMPETSSGWVLAHKPLQDHFPAMAKQLETEAHALGIHKWLSWEFQFEDLIEVCIRPTGCAIAWKQGLGKARLAAALILLKRAKHGLVTMPACILDEFGGRLHSAGLPESMWQIIRCPEDLKNLRTINVISNERLRMPISSAPIEQFDDELVEDTTAQDGTDKVPKRRKKRSRNTYAKKLRHRISVCVCDEGDFLANPESDQSRAVAQVSAKTLFALSGTPIANVPRNMINLGIRAVGDGVVGQPYAEHHPMLEIGNVETMQHASRSTEAFARTFCTFEWVTNQFSENMTQGAKREVPKLRNLPQYRNWLAPFVKRRLQTEPEVRKSVQIPIPTSSITTLDWDDEHLGMYLRIADEFSHWFREQKGKPSGSNLIALLARIGAVEQAASFPQRTRSGVSWGGGLTSHQQYMIDRCGELVEQGHKVVMFGEWPQLLELLAGEINRETSATAICYHGTLSQAKRRENIAEFRHGTGNVLCASFGITQAGLDLYEADYCLFPHRLWNSKCEDQALYRLLRPQQTRPVHVEKVHIQGSIHEYQAQMVTWKQSTSDAGLDWGTPLPDDVEFLHLDTVLERFVDDLAKRRGLTRTQFRDIVKGFA